MKISIITPCYNSVDTISESLASISNQTYKSIEHIVIDGNSSDNTLEVINQFGDKINILVSEDDGGIYDAMNKGIKRATGDIIGILNSDDIYHSEFVIEKVAAEFKNKDVSAVYGDLQYVGDEKEVVRDWKAGEFNPINFSKGWMPPHPTLFLRRELYEEHGLYNEDYKIAADYELILRFLYKNKLPVSYIPEILVQMKEGGVSNDGIRSRFATFLEDFKAWRDNDLKSLPGLRAQLMKRATKIDQFLPWIKKN